MVSGIVPISLGAVRKLGGPRFAASFFGSSSAADVYTVVGN